MSAIARSQSHLAGPVTALTLSEIDLYLIIFLKGAASVRARRFANVSPGLVRPDTLILSSMGSSKPVL